MIHDIGDAQTLTTTKNIISWVREVYSNVKPTLHVCEKERIKAEKKSEMKTPQEQEALHAQYINRERRAEEHLFKYF